MTDKEYFEAICKVDSETVHSKEGIGSLSEKRLHRIIKSYLANDPTCHEVAVGKYFADVLSEGEIFEIQTKALSRLLPKLKYYLEETPYSVTVIHPVIRNKKIIRIDPETGEILRQKISPKHGSSAHALPEIHGLRELLGNDRLQIKLMLIDAAEYRYSERMRYRREGAYDSELFPTMLAEVETYAYGADFLKFLPSGRQSFTAAEYSKFIGLTGRKLYSALYLLCSLGLIRKDGKTYFRN